MQDLNQSRARTSNDVFAEEEMLDAQRHVVWLPGLVEEGVEAAHRGVFFCSLSEY